MKDMVDLRGLELVIPYRGATAARRENLYAVLRHLGCTYGNYRVWVIEAADEPSFAWRELNDSRVWHLFVCDDGPFPKARLCNIGGRVCKSPVIAFHDADSIALPGGLKHCVDDLLDRDERDVWCPFGPVVNVAGDLRERFVRPDGFDKSKAGNFDLFEPYAVITDPPGATLPSDITPLYAHAAGGVVVCRREAYLKAGGYDASFTGWGGEDDELLMRVQRLGLEWCSLPGARLFHLHHDAMDRVAIARSEHGSAKRKTVEALRSLSRTEFNARVRLLARQFK